MKRVAFIHGGSYPQLQTIADPTIVAHDLKIVYGYDCDLNALDDCDSVMVADRLHPRVAAHIQPMITKFLDDPEHRLALMGEEVPNLLPELVWTAKPTNFWAWRTGEDVGLRMARREHPLWAYLSGLAVDWHFHGVYEPPAGAVSLVNLEEEGQITGSMLYHDAESYPAQLVVTTMDPSFHHGAGFMPGATQLLYRLLNWLRD